MAISVADNFSYQGTKPLDARVSFDTVAAMAAAVDATLYDGCLSYVKANKKYYSYDSTNEVDPTTGKWREYSSGGGGGDSNEQKIFWFDTELHTWFSDGDHNGFVNNGTATPNADWRYTDYIPVKYGDFVFGSLNNFGGNLPAFDMYDSNKTYLSGYKQYSVSHKNSWGWNGIISEPNAAYIRVNFNCDIWEGINTSFLGIIRNRKKNERIVLTLNSSKSRSFHNSTNIFEAFNKAWAIGDCDLYIESGNYDILTDCEFTNSQGLSKNTIVGTGDYSQNRACGMRVGRNNRYYGNGGKITLINSGQYENNDYVVSLVSALHICGSCELNNLFVEVTNCRYAVHEDAPAYMYPEELAQESEGYVVKYNQCNMVHNGITYSSATYTSNCVIGAGTYIKTKSYIIGGYYAFKANGGEVPAISYHNNSNANSEEYVFIEGVQLGAAANHLQFYGFVADGSIVQAFVNGCWTPIYTKIVGTKNRIVLKETDFARNVYNQYNNSIGGSYNGYPLCSYSETKTSAELDLDDSGTYKDFKTLTEVQDIVSVEAMLIIKDSNTPNKYLYWAPRDNGSQYAVRLDWRVELVNNTAIVKVALTDPYKYSSGDTLRVRVIVKYTETNN